MITPILLNKNAFDKSNETIFSFSSIGGDQVASNRLQILENSTLSVAYDSLETTYVLEHALPINTLENGKYYIAKLKTYNVNGDESNWSNTIQFYCFTTPTFEFINLDTTINTSNILFEVGYDQLEKEPLSQYKFTLYDFTTEEILQESELLYNSASSLPPLVVSNLFGGLLNGKKYFIDCVGKTLNGIDVSIDKQAFLVEYVAPEISATIKFESDCDNGTNNITSRFVYSIGYSDDGESIYLNDESLDIRDDRRTTTWDDGGFEIENEFTFKLHGKQFNPSTEIVNEFGNDDYEKLVIEYMNDELDETPIVEEFDNLNITAGDFDQDPFTHLKFKYKFYQTLGTKTYSEFVRLTYTDKNGAITIIDSNKIPQTEDDDQVLIWIRYNGFSNWSVILKNEGVV